MFKVSSFTNRLGFNRSISWRRCSNIIRKLLYSVFRVVFLLSISYIILYPLFYMVSSAFKPTGQALDPSVVWVPKSLSIENFQVAFEMMKYPRSFLNSITMLVLPGLISVLTCSFPAYGFARFRFREKNILFSLVLLTIIIPPQVMLAPLYLNYAHLDFLGILSLVQKVSGIDLRLSLINTPFTFWLPAIFGTGLRSGLFVFIYRQFFKGMPKELEEAAYIDGAGPLKTFFRIVLPSSGPAILCVLLLSMIWYWNEYDLSTMFSIDNFPLPYMLTMVKSMVIQSSGQYNMASTVNIVMAGCILFLLPTLIFYMGAQKFFMQSIDRVGIVG